MNQKKLKQLAVVLFGVIVILVALLIWAYGSSGPDLDAMASATPQVPIGTADEEALQAALAELPRDLNVQTVDALRERDDVLILDVRTPAEYASGRVPGSHNVPVGQLAALASQLPDDRPLILTCRTGNRSGQGVDILSDAGLTNAVHMEGGMQAWRHADLEVEQ